MVCPLGSGRMATMARLLVTEGLSQATAEEVGHQKFAAQYIQRELREADEANLLDEEDMQVFGSKPMGDPLHLVCCNACKKPVKTSQYAAHAEICRLLNSTEETIFELDVGARHKKPPKKERKKLLTAHAKQAVAADKQKNSESIDAAGTAVTGSSLDEQVGLASSFLIGIEGVSPGNGDHVAGVMPPPVKRSKLVAAECLPISDDLEAARGVTEFTCINRPEAATCSEFPKDLNAESRPYDHVVGRQRYMPVQEHSMPIKDLPIPLATKMYYSQRNHRFRSALSHLLYNGMAKEQCSETVCFKGFQGATIPLEASLPDNFSHEQMDEQFEKKQKDACSQPTVEDHEQFLAQTFEECLVKAGGSSTNTNTNSSDHFPVTNVLATHAVSVGMIRSKYLSKPYSFVGPPVHAAT